MTLKNEDSHTQWLEGTKKTFLLVCWADCSQLISHWCFPCQEGRGCNVPMKIKQKLVSFTWNSPNSAISECLRVCVPPPLPSWGQGQLVLVQSPVSPPLWKEQGKASCFLLNYWLEFPFTSIGAYHWASPRPVPRCCFIYWLLSSIGRNQVIPIPFLRENLTMEQASAKQKGEVHVMSSKVIGMGCRSKE